MEKEELLHRQNKMLSCLIGLPKKILSLHGRDNITEFVLHDLCQEDCFNLRRAAYFVNNPDFNCLKGVAGISLPDVPQGLWEDIWRQGEMFSTYMRNSPFNRAVRGVSQCSMQKTELQEGDLVKEVARKLGIERPSFHSVDMKHDNHGLFIFEKSNQDDGSIDRHLQNGASMLGFCPVF